MQWDPQQYVRFAGHRDRPFHELVARVGAVAPRRVLDVGCGPGTLTATLAARWPGAVVHGLDSSPQMIEAAAPLATPSLTFGLGDAAEVDPADVDVLVSNATLQWVPDHLGVLQRWAARLRPGSWLACQVPGNFDAPSHVLMRSLAESGRWRGRLDGVLRHDDAVATPARYAALLLDAGLVADVWETTYQQVLPGPDPVLEWVRGTGLRPVLAALDAGDAARFETEYAVLLREAYPRTAHGTVFGFRRMFAVGHRPGSGDQQTDAVDRRPDRSVDHDGAR